MANISFKNNGVSPGVLDLNKVKELIISIFRTEQKQFKLITYIFCKDEYLLKLNQQYLKHDTFTDILTFTLSGISLPIVAEIYISVERVKENAIKYKISYLEELLRVAIHGALHLCGYSDHTAALKAVMRQKENFYLGRLQGL